MKPSVTSTADQTAQPNSILGCLFPSLLACVVLCGCQSGPQPEQAFPPAPESRPQAVAVPPSAAVPVSTVVLEAPVDAQEIAPQSTLAKAATQTTGLTLIKRQMVTLTANLPVNTNGYRLEKALSETSTWTLIANFATNRFTYQDLNLQNPTPLYRAVPIAGPPVPPPKLASKQLWWDASPTAGVTNYALKWGTNVLRTTALTATASNLVSGATASFTVTALGFSGESVPTKAVSYVVP